MVLTLTLVSTDMVKIVPVLSFELHVEAVLYIIYMLGTSFENKAVLLIIACYLP
jgi:hypothetical protein